jgi:hypothetical protein
LLSPFTPTHSAKHSAQIFTLTVTVTVTLALTLTLTLILLFAIESRIAAHRERGPRDASESRRAKRAQRERRARQQTDESLRAYATPSTCAVHRWFFTDERFPPTTRKTANETRVDRRSGETLST